MIENKPRIWDENGPPRNLRQYVEFKGRFVPPWHAPIVVIGSPDAVRSGRVYKQGDPGSGTTPSPRGVRGTGETGSIGLGEGHVEGLGEPLADLSKLALKEGTPEVIITLDTSVEASPASGSQ